MQEARACVDKYLHLPPWDKCHGRCEVEDDDAECDVEGDGAFACKRWPKYAVKRADDEIWLPVCHLPSTSFVNKNDVWDETAGTAKCYDQRRFFFAHRDEAVWQLLHKMPWEPGMFLTASRVPDLFTGIGYNSMAALIRDLQDGPKEKNEYQARIMEEGSKAEPIAIRRFLERGFTPRATGWIHSDVMGMYVDGTGVIAATPDCIFLSEGVWKLLEIKCPQRVQNDMGKYWKYLVQACVQLACVRIGGRDVPLPEAFVYVWDGTAEVVLRIGRSCSAINKIALAALCFMTEFEKGKSAPAIKKILARNDDTNWATIQRRLWNEVTLVFSSVGPLVWTQKGRVDCLRPVQPCPELDPHYEPLQKVTRTD